MKITETLLCAISLYAVGPASSGTDEPPLITGQRTAQSSDTVRIRRGAPRAVSDSAAVRKQQEIDSAFAACRRCGMG